MAFDSFQWPFRVRLGSELKEWYYRARSKRLKYFKHCEATFRHGIGLEIGGPSGIFGEGMRGHVPVYRIANRIDNCNFSSRTTWEGEIRAGNTFAFHQNKPLGRQYVAEASDLSCVEDKQYDFVLSSHCIEHLANPLQGIREWVRVIKPGGLLVLVVPNKDGTFDHRRPVTSLAHLVDDFEQGMDESDLTHLPEILELHDLTRDPDSQSIENFRERSLRNMENRCLHQHVFDTHLAVQVVDHVGLQVLAVEHFLPYHIVIVAKKMDAGQSAENRILKVI